MSTPEQRAADNALGTAIGNVLSAYNRFPDGTTMVSYVVVVEGVSLDDMGDVESNTHTVITTPGERLSVAKGNLHIGLDVLVDGNQGDDE